MQWNVRTSAYDQINYDSIPDPDPGSAVEKN